MATLSKIPSPQLRETIAPLVRSGEAAAPLGVIDIAAFDFNAEQMVTRAGGLPIRVASKSLRSVAALRRAFEHDGYQGILGFSVPEALDLYEEGFRDIVVAYPSVHRPALAWLGADAGVWEAITVMVDSVELLDLLAPGMRVAIDIDCTLHLLGVVIGPRRSPIRTPEQVDQLAREILKRDLRLVGMMAYEGQVASVADGEKGPTGAIKRWLRTKAMEDLAPARAGMGHRQLGGWIASGPPAKDRVPVPVWPKGLKYSGMEGAGEMQSPLHGPAAKDLCVEDLVWFRHAKAGEMTEHLDGLLAVDANNKVKDWDTYRGKGWTFR